jgi:hypothetical protein
LWLQSEIDLSRELTYYMIELERRINQTRAELKRHEALAH